VDVNFGVRRIGPGDENYSDTLIKLSTPSNAQFCPKGHELLVEMPFKETTWICDGCRDKLVQGDKVLICRACGCSICTKCVERGVFLDDLKQIDSQIKDQNLAVQDLAFPGISLNFLASLVIDGDSNAVCEKLVKPATEKNRCSLASLIHSSPEHSHHVKPVPDVFVSYCWSYSFRHVVNTLKEKYGDANPYVFLDIACVNQNQAASTEKAQSLVQSFEKSMSQVNEVVVIIKYWRRPSNLDRAWCLLEMLTASKLGKPTHVLLVNEDKLKFNKSTCTNANLTLEFFKQMFAPISVEELQSSVEQDRLVILDVLKAHGVFKASEDALKYYKSVMMESSQQLASSLHEENRDAITGFQSLAYMHEAMGKLDRAAKYWQKAVDCCTANRSIHQLPGLLANLGRVLSDAGRHDEAITHLKQAMEEELKFQQGNRNHAHILFIEANLAASQLNAGQLDQAQKSYQAASSIATNLYGPAGAKSNPIMHEIMFGMGLILLRTKNFAKALKHFESLSALLEEQYGKDHAIYARALLYRGQALCGLHKYKKALEVLAEALSCARLAVGQQSNDVANNLKWIVVALQHLGRSESISKYQIDGDATEVDPNKGEIIIKGARIIEYERDPTAVRLVLRA